jgi:GDP-D-mannose dehydratase
MDMLVGDAGKAKQVLGWRSLCSFDDLVAEMVDVDLKAVAQLNAESSMAIVNDEG